MSLRITPALLSLETTVNNYLNVELVTITGARLICRRCMVNGLRVYGDILIAEMCFTVKLYVDIVIVCTGFTNVGV